MQNMGSVDKFIRSMVGTAFLVNIIILEPGVAGTIILLVLGVAMLASAWTGYCPAYKPFGICTCSGSASCACEAEAAAPAEKKEFKIVCNVGNTDRFIRALVGVALIVNIIVVEPGVVGGIILFVLGAALIASAVLSYCPLYQYLGMDTCSGGEKKAE